MPGLRRAQDAYGRAMLDHLEGRGESAIIERDDGLITTDIAVEWYFSDYKAWRSDEKQAMRYVRGRVLDVGAGAGRHALHLQNKGHEVVAIDNSPLAVEVCRRRGVKDARVVPFVEVSKKLGTFDTIVMFGNNFGLFGGRERARWMLRRLKGLTSDDARIVAVSLDPYGATVTPEHLEYHRFNKRRGRMSGQIRMRVRYLKLKTPWFDYLLASPDEMRDVVDGTGWRVEHFIDSDDSPFYIAVIQRN